MSLILESGMPNSPLSQFFGFKSGHGAPYLKALVKWVSFFKSLHRMDIWSCIGGSGAAVDDWNQQ